VKARRDLILGFLALLTIPPLSLAACAPKLPAGVDEARLDDAISAAIGDPNTCVLIAPSGGSRVAYRYNTHTVCARVLPACEGEARRTVNDLLKAVARDGRPRAASCPSAPDGSREVAWAAGPVAGRGLIYAVVMEGERAFPSRMVVDRLTRAFKDAGL
jgi:hypothetical protein